MEALEKRCIIYSRGYNLAPKCTKMSQKKLFSDRWATPVNQLGPQTHNALRIYLKDPNWSHSSHYGVLSAMIALGPRVLDEFLVPQLEAYILRIAEQMQQATNTANTAVLVKRTADLKVSRWRHFDFDQGGRDPSIFILE